MNLQLKAVRLVLTGFLQSLQTRKLFKTAKETELQLTTDRKLSKLKD